MKAKQRTDGSIKVTMTEHEAEILRALCLGVYSVGDLDDVSINMMDTIAGFGWALGKAGIPVKWKHRKRVEPVQIFPVADGKKV